MPDRKKVINGLQCIIDGTVRCESCGYAIDKHGHHSCQQNCASDALTLLKEQEAVPVDNGKCPSCNWDFENGELDFSNINESRFYCPRCGQAVKWNDNDKY